MKEYTLSVGTLDDAQDIQNLLYPSYFEETAYKGMTYNADNTRNQVLSWLEDLCFIARAEGKVVGVAVTRLLRTFYDEIEADVDMFVVHKDYRGTGVARDLVNAVVANAEANNAKVIYTSCLSGLGETNDKLYQNLYKKFGFEPLGTVMIRREI